MGFYLMSIAVVNKYFSYRFAENLEIWLRSPFCIILSFLIAIANLMSTFILFMITLDRYVHLVYPLSDFRFSHKTVVTTLLCLWIFSIIYVGIPTFYSINQPPINRLFDINGACLPGNVDNIYYYTWLISYCGITFVIWVLIIILHGIILIILSQSRKQVRQQQASSDGILIVKMIIIVTTDLVCWFPLYVVILKGILGIGLDTHALSIIVILALPFNSCVNPIVLAIFTSRFLNCAGAFLRSSNSNFCHFLICNSKNSSRRKSKMSSCRYYMTR